MGVIDTITSKVVKKDPLTEEQRQDIDMQRREKETERMREKFQEKELKESRKSEQKETYEKAYHESKLKALEAKAIRRAESDVTRGDRIASSLNFGNFVSNVAKIQKAASGSQKPRRQIKGKNYRIVREATPNVQQHNLSMNTSDFLGMNNDSKSYGIDYSHLFSAKSPIGLNRKKGKTMWG